jgi:hypothetical protein
LQRSTNAQTTVVSAERDRARRTADIECHVDVAHAASEARALDDLALGPLASGYVYCVRAELQRPHAKERLLEGLRPADAKSDR